MAWYPVKNAEFQGAGFVFLRALGLVYLTAFLCLGNDVLPLIGKVTGGWLSGLDSRTLRRPLGIGLGNAIQG